MTKLTLKVIAEMSDEEVYKLSMPRPGHPEMRGFMLNPRCFDDKQELAEVTVALVKRLGKIIKKTNILP